MNKQIKKVVDEIIMKFIQDFWSQRKCNFSHHHIVEELEIMLPKDLPIPRYEDAYDTLSVELQFPAIEVIYISEEWQKKGFLNHLVERLLEVSWVRGVVIQTVNNPELARHLLHSSRWIPILNSHSYSNLNRIIPLARDNQEYYEFFLELFERKRPIIHKGDMGLIKDQFVEGVKKNRSDIATLTDDQLCGFARIGEPNRLFNISDDMYAEFKNNATEQGRYYDESPYHFAGKSKFINSFLTKK